MAIWGIVGLNAAQSSVGDKHRREPWLAGVTADHKQSCLQVRVRSWEGIPTGAWKWEGFEVRPHELYLPDAGPPSTPS